MKIIDNGGVMKSFKVYLSGPITGLDYDGAIGWTDYARKQLKWNPNQVTGTNNIPTSIEGYRPMRGKQHLKNVKDLPAVVETPNPIATSKAILNRDKYDVMSADCLLVNLLGAKRVSIGTVAEISWAHILQKPIVLVMEKQDNLHMHSFIIEMATHWTDDLDEGIQIVKNILLPD